jgi:hypothetical protein
LNHHLTLNISWPFRLAALHEFDKAFDLPSLLKELDIGMVTLIDQCEYSPFHISNGSCKPSSAKVVLGFRVNLIPLTDFEPGHVSSVAHFYGGKGLAIHNFCHLSS